ncbi:MAG: hypothetical protein K9G60_01870 [Pseudolabrys sp.]|nr:hypothetical protein [Pseudolabrys sp.]
MAKQFDRVKFGVPSTPGTGTVTVGTRYDSSFYLPDEQGATDGTRVFYMIQKANKDSEVGIGTIDSGATEVTRDTVLSSIVGGTKGTSKINIDGTAFMAFVTPAIVDQQITGQRTVTGTTDTIVDGDGGGMVTYNSASAVAVSVAEAGDSLAFLQDWCTYVRNINAGAVTITPATSTINGAATLALANGDSAMIISDGANYVAIVWRAPKVAIGSINTQRFTASGTYTPTAGMVYAKVMCLGAGAGGGGVAQSSGQGGGGGGGSGSWSIAKATAASVGAAKSVTIGAAGAGGTAGNNAGTAGGDTTVAGHCIGKGGSPGGGAAANVAGTAGLGGIGGTGDDVSTGEPGGTGPNVAPGAGLTNPSAFGGSSPWGGGGRQQPGATATTGSAATGYGAGGGGGNSFNNSAAAAGGAGTAGLVVIEEYIAA